MLFSELLKQAGVCPVSRSADAEVTQIVADSRRCGVGSCFVAVRGAKQDGHQFIPTALKAGSSAIVCEDASNVPAGATVAVVKDARVAVARMAMAICGWPSRKLTTIGVTGTNGKSTTTCLIRDILQADHHAVALLGTLFYETGGRTLEANQTTPDPISLADMTAEMVELGKTHLVMEASSHALHQERCAGLDFKVGVFTNLTGDHLDYHKTMEEYLLAKRRLFEGLGAESTAVLNLDDPASQSLAAAARDRKARVLFYGLQPEAEFFARVRKLDAAGTVFDLVTPTRTVPVRTPLIGKHNVSNCLAAAGACAALGLNLEHVARVLEHVNIVPGRLERVPVDASFSIFVDYAHTDDALVNVLSALRPVTKGKLILVFGCGGDRDRTKRPRMAAVAEKLADEIVVTSDNPRTEQPAAIIDDILKGFSPAGLKRIHMHVDRRNAISHAVNMAGEGDILLIAGKGHEKYQIVGAEKHHFDDVEVAGESVALRGRPA